MLYFADKLMIVHYCVEPPQVARSHFQPPGEKAATWPYSAALWRDTNPILTLPATQI